MITHNNNDINLTKIMEEGKLKTLSTISNYYIFGLRSDWPEAVKIELPRNGILNKRVESLIKFLDLNKISHTIIYITNSDEISIGLRRDLREMLINDKPLLASAILSTIIYCLDGRLNLKKLSTYKPNSDLIVQS